MSGPQISNDGDRKRVDVILVFLLTIRYPTTSKDTMDREAENGLH